MSVWVVYRNLLSFCWHSSMVEQSPRKGEVGGSTPLASSNWEIAGAAQAASIRLAPQIGLFYQKFLKFSNALGLCSAPLCGASLGLYFKVAKKAILLPHCSPRLPLTPKFRRAGRRGSLKNKPVRFLAESTRGTAGGA